MPEGAPSLHFPGLQVLVVASPPKGTMIWWHLGWEDTKPGLSCLWLLP